MGRKCSICAHPDRREIDSALLTGGQVAKIAREYGVSRGALTRHRDHGHITDAIAKAAAAEAVALGATKKAVTLDRLTQEVEEIQVEVSFLSRVQSLLDRSLAVLDAAERENDLRAANGALREVRGNLELLGKATGELSSGVTVNIIQSAEFKQVIAILQEELPDEYKERFANRLYEISS